MKCGKCGAEVADGYRFCLICGTKIEAQEESAMESSPKPLASGSLPSAQGAAGGMAAASAMVTPKPRVGMGDASSNSLRVTGETLVVAGCLMGIFAIYIFFAVPFIGWIFGPIALIVAISIGFKGANMKAQGKAAVRADQTYQLLQATQERLMRIEGQQVLGQMSQASSAISNAAGGGQPVAQYQIACPKCGSLSSSTKFCPECGASLKKKCANCGNDIASGTKFCPECGAKVS